MIFSRPNALPRWEALTASDCVALAHTHYGTPRGKKAALHARAKQALAEGRVVMAHHWQAQADALFW